MSSTKKKSRRSWISYLPYVFLIALVCNGLLIFTRVSPALNNNSKTAGVKKERVKVQIGDREFDNTELTDEKYRELALQMDREIVDALKTKIADRKREYESERNDPEMFHEERLRQLQEEFDNNFSSEDLKHKGTLGYELNKSIEKMKEDAPSR